MRRRSGIVEHPFGTLKCRAGYRHFLVRGFNKVRGEWSLMALCYNLTRALNIIGFEDIVDRRAEPVATLQYVIAAVLQLLLIVPGSPWMHIKQPSAILLMLRRSP